MNQNELREEYEDESRRFNWLKENLNDTDLTDYERQDRLEEMETIREKLMYMRLELKK